MEQDKRRNILFGFLFASVVGAVGGFVATDYYTHIHNRQVGSPTPFLNPVGGKKTPFTPVLNKTPKGAKKFSFANCKGFDYRGMHWSHYSSCWK